LLLSANLDPYPPMLQHQFVALAQLRAIETGRAVVSVANTGPSVLVDARGKVEQQLPPGRPATGLFTVPQLDALTPYDRFGNAILAVVLVLAWLGRLAEAVPWSDP
jgi:apolipoprotein N-acyltransferase